MELFMIVRFTERFNDEFCWEIHSLAYHNKEEAIKIKDQIFQSEKYIVVNYYI